MHVHIGPVSSGSATLWIAYTRTVLAHALTRPGQGPPVTPETVEAFESFLDVWDDVADAEPEFVWSAEVDAEQIEFLVHAWFSIAEQLADEAKQRGFPMAPPEGEEFYHVLVTAVLDALAQEGRGTTEFAEQLRDGWPGFKPDD